MVASNLALEEEAYSYDRRDPRQPGSRCFVDLPQDNVKWCSVSLSKVFDANKRLEAAVFDVRGKHAREAVVDCKYSTLLLPDTVSQAYYPGRFKRIYSDSVNGVPFDKATATLIAALKLPLIHKLKTARFDNSADFDNFSTTLSHLSGRLDGSFVVPNMPFALEELGDAVALQLLRIGARTQIEALGA